MQKSILILFIIYCLACSLAHAQCPDPALTAPTTLCTGEEGNFSAGGDITNYQWDFCPGDLANSPIVYSPLTTELRRAEEPEIAQDGNDSYLFIPGQSSLFRARINSDRSLSNPVYLNSMDAINRAVAIELVEVSGNWYGFTIDFNTGNIIRLEFGSDLTNLSPTLVSLNTDSYFTNPRGFDLIKDNGGYFLAVTSISTNTLSIATLGTDITAGISSGNISTVPLPGTDLQEVAFIQDCDEWKAVAVSKNDNRIFYLSFGNSLLNDPVISDITPEGSLADQPAGIQLAYDDGHYYGLITSTVSGTYLLDFGSSLNTSPNASALSGLPSQARGLFGIDLAKEESRYYGYAINTTSGEIISYVWPEVACTASVAYTEASSPTVSFSEPGALFFDALLTGSDGSNIKKNVEIIVQDVPAVNYSISGRCLDTPVQLQANSLTEQRIVSYQWEVDGGFLASGEEAVFEPASAGTYRLSVTAINEAGCSFTYEEEISIQAASSLSPAFIYQSGPLCSNSELSFTDTSSAGAGETVIAWGWDFDDPASGDSNVATGQQAFHSFSAAGTYQVGLTITSSSGCTAMISREVIVQEGPEAAFSFSNSCQGDIIQFTNQSTGTDITGYFWSFGDGTTASVQNPVHSYEESGTYPVDLTVTSGNGCATTLTKHIRVFEPPFVDFIYENACSGTSTRFFDRSDAGDSNVSQWRWEVESQDDEVITYLEPSPEHIFTNPGTYGVKLVVTNDAGCADSLTQNVTVLPAPQVAFDIIEDCPGDATQFFDRTTTDPSTSLTGRLWIINGRLFNEQNPRVVFSEPGTYDVTLSVDADNACSATVTRQVVIADVPNIDFSLSSTCSGQPVTLEAEFPDGVNPLNLEWDVQGVGTSDTPGPVFTFPDAGDYTITLSATLPRGCVISRSRTVSIVPAPQAAFSYFPTEGRPPLSVRFFNSSTGAISYEWYINGTRFSVEEEPVYTLTEEGLNTITLVAINGSGCTDSLSRAVQVIDPARDLKVRSVSLADNSDGSAGINIEVYNNSQLPAESPEILIETASLSLSITWEGTISPGETTTIVPSISLNPRTLSATDYVCATVSQPGFTDLSPGDNSACLPLQEEIIFIPPSPNPAGNEVIAGLISMENSKVSISIINSKGAVMAVVNEQVDQGRNLFKIATSDYAPGIYYLQMQTKNLKRTFKVMVYR
ncbi:PKD domain-containing protein [Roseivirga sp. BDSF3-8]|uniref:PKD domain-containing protein n=1 Tax=Roseivirga sp. BDSF3-8 TaxID=3241598 RepID=UPI0035323DAE